MHLSQMIFDAASSRLAVSSTITGLLPPNSRVTELKFLAAAAIIIFSNGRTSRKEYVIERKRQQFLRNLSIPSNKTTSSRAKHSATIFSSKPSWPVWAPRFQYGAIAGCYCRNQGRECEVKWEVQGEMIKQTPFDRYWISDRIVPIRGEGSAYPLGRHPWS